MLTADIKELFTSSERETVLILTVGNPYRSDDGVGPYIAQKISSPPSGLYILNAGDTPENSIDQAVALCPDRTIIIDAADFKGIPGEVRLIPPEAIPGKTMSTHTFPLTIIAKILAEDTGSDVHFMGIQPKSMEFGETLTPSVKKTADEIIALLQQVRTTQDS